MSRGESKGFIVYYDNEIIVCRLSDDEAGKLFKSLFPYATEHIRPDFESSPALAMAFDVLSLAIDRNAKWYKEMCSQNRQNVMKRWEKNKGNTTEYDRKQSDTTEYGRVPNKEKDKEKEKNKNKEKEKEKDNISYQQIADLYNETCVSFPRLTKLSDSRKKAIRARLKQYSVDDFRRMFELAESSDFLKGKNDRNWSATFDWMVKDANMAKILDGNYQDKADFKPHEETREEREARLMREWEKEHENLPDYNFPPIPEGVEPVIWGDDLE